MMSYDPSSLNRNKTLLEAIEEVKKFLIANPCYKVFYANTNYLVGTTTYSKTYIDDADSIAEYDVVFFNNNYYGKVESVGDSTFTIIGATNFKGDTGAQGTPGTPGTPGADGQDGADGTDGISITNVQIDASNHLICSLSNGTTIDAGELPTPFIEYITLLGTSGTLTTEEYNKLVSSNDTCIISAYYIGIFRKSLSNPLQYYMSYTMIDKTSSGINIVEIKINTDGTRAWTSSSIPVDPVEGTSVKSTGQTSGKVLTADGTGGASWETPSTPDVEGTAVKSTGETSGKVLTADGSGGASWENAGGGTTLTSRSTTVASSLTLSQKLSFLNTLLTTCKGNIVNNLISFSNIDGVNVNVPLSDCNSASVGHLAVRSISHNIPNNAIYIINLIYNSNALQTASSSIVKISLSTFTMSSLTLGSIEPIATNTTFTYFNDTTFSV